MFTAPHLTPGAGRSVLYVTGEKPPPVPLYNADAVAVMKWPGGLLRDRCLKRGAGQGEPAADRQRLVGL